MSNSTPGQALASELRRYFSIGHNTRRFRGGEDLRERVITEISHAATMPGYFTERTQGILRTGFAVALAYEKHVNGYRISGQLHHRITSMTTWQFTALLGQMLDAGVTNNGEGERFFAAMGR